jgi:hypothetical protein
MGYFIYLAATYDSGAYGACTYQGDCTTATGVGAPDTGFLSQPQVMVPLILGAAILIAALILVAKKVIRKAKRG